MDYGMQMALLQPFFDGGAVGFDGVTLEIGFGAQRFFSLGCKGKLGEIERLLENVSG